MSSGQTGWLLLFMLALFLIAIGVQGNLGVAFAILFTPKYVLIGDEGPGFTPNDPTTGTAGSVPSGL